MKNAYGRVKKFIGCSGGGRDFRVGGGANQFARAPESAGPPLGAEGPLFF